MEEIEKWKSTRTTDAWCFYFEKCKMFRIKWESDKADIYIALKCHRFKDLEKNNCTCTFKIVVSGKSTNVSPRKSPVEDQSETDAIL